MIKSIVVGGGYQANCYFVYDDTKQAVIIDPGDEPEKIITEIKKLGLQVVTIVNTHGHPDHIGANKPVKEFTNAPVMIHKNDELILSYFTGKADSFLSDDDIIKYGNSKLQVIHTPGHTPGGICLLGDGFVFTGDTLFCGTVGRCDLPGGDEEALLKSINQKLFTLPDETKIYPGHEGSCTIGGEKQHNPLI